MNILSLFPLFSLAYPPLLFSLFVQIDGDDDDDDGSADNDASCSVGFLGCLDRVLLLGYLSVFMDVH